MSIACPYCGGDSLVTLTRRTQIQVRRPGVDTNVRRATAVRTRRCGECRYKWKTVEMPVTRRRRVE